MTPRNHADWEREDTHGRPRNDMATISQLNGVTEAHVTALRDAGIRTLSDLLAADATDGGRREVATVAGAAPEDVARWTGVGRLVQVDGIGPATADLLVRAGLTSVEDLAYSRPRDLAARLGEVSSGAGPQPRRVAQWIAAAHEMLHPSYSRNPQLLQA